jgi:hypothetical protein
MQLQCKKVNSKLETYQNFQSLTRFDKHPEQASSYIR